MEVIVFWFRRDLRLFDNAGLYHALKEALKSGYKVIPIFIFDKNILDHLSNQKDARVTFIYSAIEEMRDSLKLMGYDIQTFYGTPIEAYNSLSTKYSIKGIYTNEDYENYANQRDAEIKDWANSQRITFKSYKDIVIFEKDEILKADRKPYTVFTPYSRKWKEKLNNFYLKSYPIEKYQDNYLQFESTNNPTLEDMGFMHSNLPFPNKLARESIIVNYDKTRNFPSNDAGTSKLGVHLRFGTVSIRELARLGEKLNSTYLNELIWRDFYHSILYHFPQILTESFKPQYDKISWRKNEEDFQKWKDGNTGYPLVDAGMRELNTTGYMHNRVRMVVASFLTKHLLIDWRWGERYFAEKLLDYDYAANNGGWQWAAGSGCDAAPYFRVFNPELQLEKFDKDLKYVKKWVPEFGTFNYSKPMVEHKFARERALEVYKAGLNSQL